MSCDQDTIIFAIVVICFVIRIFFSCKNEIICNDVLLVNKLIIDTENLFQLFGWIQANW